VGKMMGTNNFWRARWESRSKEADSNYELDRGTSVTDPFVEKLSENELIEFIDPQGDELLFDAGCGTGVNVARFGSRVKRIIGMDYSEGMIKRAKKRILEELDGKGELFVGSITHIGLKDSLLDKIICMSVLQYLNDEECIEAFREFVRISKNGGIIILHVKNLSSLYLRSLYIVKKIKLMLRRKTKLEYYRSYRWYEQRLREMGAQIAECNSFNIFYLEFLPKVILNKIKKIELKYYKSLLFRDTLLGRHGSEYKIKARVVK